MTSLGDLSRRRYGMRLGLSSREDRNRFVDETAGMKKAQREAYFEAHFRDAN